MKLYYAPGTSAVGIRILLEEIGGPYEIAMLDLAAREQYQPAFSKINPKSKVPALIRDDGSVLTEFGAIARWLALTNPDAALLPLDPESEARAIELLDYVVGTVHMRGFSRMIVTETSKTLCSRPSSRASRSIPTKPTARHGRSCNCSAGRVLRGN